MSARVRVVLLDLDGVLVDSRAAIGASIDHALAEHELTPLRPGEVDAYIGPPLHDAFDALLRSRGADPSLAWSCVGAYRERYARTCRTETLPIGGIAEALGVLRARWPMAVATSKPETFATEILDELGMLDAFAAVCGPSLDARSEPKAVTVARALERLGVSGPDAVMVGDRRHDVIGAHANRARAVGVLWGIGDEAELREAGADALAARPIDLSGVLEAMQGSLG